MKKVVAFLLALIIFVTPVTTLVKADVVIGDNDETIINENATILGHKLALLESLSDLALSGVSEFTISNTNDVDTYLDSLWSELDDAINYLDSGEWTNDLTNELASKYFTNLVQYKDYINNRGEYFAHLLPSGNPTSNLLSTFFANNIFGKHSTLQNNLSLDAFRSLAALTRGGSNPSPDPDFNFITDINNFFIPIYPSGTSDLFQYSSLTDAYNSSNVYYSGNLRYFSYIGDFNNSYNIHNGYNIDNQNYIPTTLLSPALTINVDTSNENNVIVTYSTSTKAIFDGKDCFGLYVYDNRVWCDNDYNSFNYNQSSFVGLSSAINYIYSHYCNINLYVDGVLWAKIPDNVSSLPILDIDGFLKLYGNNNPQQYELLPKTQIDYDQLYQVIYNAIRDNLPISQGDINYYDSHDTIYSPTIINNYGEEEGDESDLIDTILDYAVIPKFDTAIAQPMRQALTNGVVIMNNSITNVIPNEILLILGACFFLLLFAVVINRMIK